MIVGAGELYVFRADGSLLPGFPFRGGNAFASSAAVGDIDGDGLPEIVIGCDDNFVHAVRVDGSSLDGFPVGDWG